MFEIGPQSSHWKNKKSKVQSLTIITDIIAFKCVLLNIKLIAAMFNMSKDNVSMT